MAKLNLGHMPPNQMMGMYQAAREKIPNAQAAGKYSAMAKHPSAAGRNSSFLEAATYHDMHAANAGARMYSAAGSVVPAESFNSRQSIFDTARQAHNFGSN